MDMVYLGSVLEVSLNGYIIGSYYSDLLLSGEFMQLGSKEDEAERFNHYMKKTFKKTASLIAHSCKAVSFVIVCTHSDFCLEFILLLILTVSCI